MTDFTSAERKQRIITVSARVLINILIFIFTLIKASKGFTEDIDPHTNTSVKIIIFSVIAADTLMCILDIYFPFLFHTHFILNILFVIFSFLILTAVSGVVPAIILSLILAAPFVYYSLRTKKNYDAVFKAVSESIKK